MARNVTTLTSKGQVTIPKHVRDQLGLKPSDKVEIDVRDGEARLRKSRLTLEEMMGCVPALGLDPDEAIARAKEERAEQWRPADH